MHGHASCVQFLRKQSIPLILLGGGGYIVKNVARTWTYETACALGMEGEIDLNLPWNEYFESFGPRYRLEVPCNNMEDLNVKDGSLDVVRCVYALPSGSRAGFLALMWCSDASCALLYFRENALEQLSRLKGPPSVQMQDVPRESLAQHLGLGKDDETAKDELDEELARTYSNPILLPALPSFLVLNLTLLLQCYRTHAIRV